MDEFKKNLTHSVGMRIFIFLISFFVCSLIGSVIVALLAIGNHIDRIKLGQGISSALMFIVPPIILYAITRRPQPMQQLGFRKPVQWWMLLVGFAVMFLSLPLTNLLTDWNERVDLGPWVDLIEQSAADLTQRMMEVDSIGGLLVNLLVLALIPAIGEELTFRGVLQQALTKGCKNVHVAVWLSAFIFSFIHFQFYGFLPRMFLGLLLGYLFYYSGSIWTSILMHFANNGTAVVVSYLDYNGIVNVDWEHFGSTSNVIMLVVSLLLTVGSIVLVSKKQYKYGR